MTIEDTMQGRIAVLNGFLRELHRGRRSKERAVAGKVRRNLIAEIEEMIAYEQDELAVDETYFRRTSESDRVQDEGVDLGWSDADDFSTTYDTVALLDIAPLISEEGEEFDPAMNRWYRVEEGYPKKVPVSADELGDLMGLIERIEEALDITFTVEWFFWTEEALTIASFAQEGREAAAG